MRSVLYRFPDLDEFERFLQSAAIDPELPVPHGETVDDGEWVLAIFELGPGRRATSAAGRAAVLPEGARLTFEPRDLRRLADFTIREARHAPAAPMADPHASDEAIEGTRLAARASRPTLTQPRVLVVDDDLDIRDVVSAMLEAVGLLVITVESAEEALDRIAREAFDLVVLDWNLPKMTGLDLCRALRRDPALEQMPVLFLTANASSQDMVEAFAGGADDYVVKPFRAPELGARIFSLLRRARK
ncbi:Phosphate regulon transcriptional regulatory protein PhoB (SphR) [Minicystis rosea]|nr:Phosphate regulon transcriptional regulatory protein PhoB (SphR) [Minicystis rosea]